MLWDSDLLLEFSVVLKKNSAEYILKNLLALFNDSRNGQHPACRLKGARRSSTKRKTFIGRREEEQGSHVRQTRQVGYGQVTWLLGMAGVRGSGDQVVSACLGSDSISGTAEIIIKSGLGDMGLSISNSILGLLFCF